jgi:hypothetical protein
MLTIIDQLSLLTSFSKILEKVIQTRLLNHLHKNNVINKEQCRFRKGFTTEKAIYKLINEVLNALESKQIVGGIFCDLTEGFDCIDHGILSKIGKYGITGKGRELMQPYIIIIIIILKKRGWLGVLPVP